MVDSVAAVPGCACPVDPAWCTPKGHSGSATGRFWRVPILRRGARAGGCGGRGINVQLRPQLAQRAVDAALDGGQRLSQRLGHLRHRQLGAEPQRDRLALLRRQDAQRALDRVPGLDGAEGRRRSPPARSAPGLARPPPTAGRDRAAGSARSCTATPWPARGAGRSACATAAPARTCRPAGPPPARGRPCGRRGSRTAPAPRPRRAARSRRRASAHIFDEASVERDRCAPGRPARFARLRARSASCRSRAFPSSGLRRCASAAAAVGSWPASAWVTASP